MQQRGGKVDRAIAGMASRAHGVVTRQALLAAGFSPAQIRQRLHRGSLIAIHRGVYRVGHAAPSLEAGYMAAVKACGGDALLCGRAAAHLWRLIKGRPPVPEVLAPTKRHIPGVITHRTQAIDRGDAGRCRGIPVTTVPRTLVDIAPSLPVPVLTRACHEADVLYGIGPDQIEAVLSRRSNASAASTLRRIIHGGEPVTLSALERRFLQRLREASLPLPETNRLAGGRRVDCRWPAQRLTVELDGYRFHRSRHAWERDRQREREARGRGDEFRRYTYADVVEAPRLMLHDLRTLLAR